MNALLWVPARLNYVPFVVTPYGTASDRPGLQDHVYSKGQKKRLAKRFKGAKDPLKLVIVREGEAPGRLWLRGFAAPCRHTMVVDKPMAGHKERRCMIADAHGRPMLGRQIAFH